MKFFLVSRDRYNEQSAELARVRGELEKERDRGQRLWNFLLWRVGGGVALDTSLLPESYQPLARTAAVADTDEATKNTIRAARAPGQARREIAQFEVSAEIDYQKANVMHRAPRITQEQADVISHLNQSANDAQASVRN